MSSLAEAKCPVKGKTSPMGISPLNRESEFPPIFVYGEVAGWMIWDIRSQAEKPTIEDNNC